MRVELGLSQGSLQRWHIEVARRIAGLHGVELGIRWSRHIEEQLPLRLSALLSIEQACLGIELAAPASPTDLSPYVGTGGTCPDLILDLTGAAPSAGRRNWLLTFDGKAGAASLLRALHARRAPIIAIAQTGSEEIVASLIFIAETDGMSEDYEKALAKVADLAVSAIREGGDIPRDESSVPLLGSAARPRPGIPRLIGAALARFVLTPAAATFRGTPGT